MAVYICVCLCRTKCIRYDWEQTNDRVSIIGDTEIFYIFFNQIFKYMYTTLSHRLCTQFCGPIVDCLFEAILVALDSLCIPIYIPFFFSFFQKYSFVPICLFVKSTKQSSKSALHILRRMKHTKTAGWVVWFYFSVVVTTRNYNSLYQRERIQRGQWTPR